MAKQRTLGRQGAFTAGSFLGSEATANASGAELHCWLSTGQWGMFKGWEWSKGESQVLRAAPAGAIEPVEE